MVAIKRRKGHLSEYFFKFKTQIVIAFPIPEQYLLVLMGHIWFSLYIHNLLVLY